MSNRKVLSIGFIPNDWRESQNEDQRISVGDPETSNTREFDIEIVEDDDSVSELSGLKPDSTRKLEGDEFWDKASQFYKDLSRKIKTEYGIKITPKLLQQLWALFQDELADNVHNLIVVAEEDDGAEFVNDDGEYNGCIYVRYFLEEDDEVYGERVVVIKQ